MRNLLLSISVMLCAACTLNDVEDYAQNEPTLDIREFFDGKVTAFGAINDYSGELNSTFTVDVTGEWDGNKGTLTEHFVYEDGSKDTRIWSITFSDEHNFIGTADDVVGEGVGRQYGNAVNLQYTLRQKRDDGTIDLAMDDWMYLVDETHLINKTRATKYGFNVADVTIGFVKK